jgi:hypothetical protein
MILAGLLLAVAAGAEEPRRPVLVELFTSEGCSSCPPADRILQVLDREQPVAGAEAIVLSEHVDYWNHIGWTDPFSSPAFSRRQENYAARFRTQGPYTPQMVVDGANEFVGNDGRHARDAIVSAAKREKLAVHLTRAAEQVQIEVAAPEVGKRRNLGVWVALADNSQESDVARGENRGRHLVHVAVVRSMTEVGVLPTGGVFHASAATRGAARVVVFVQERGFGPVWGASVLKQ